MGKKCPRANSKGEKNNPALMVSRRKVRPRRNALVLMITGWALVLMVTGWKKTLMAGGQ